MEKQEKTSSQMTQETPMKTDFFIDSHTHMLDYGRESSVDIEAVLSQADANNVKYIIANTTCTKQFEYMKKLSEKSKEDFENKGHSVRIIPAFGVHPCYVCEENQKEQISHQGQALESELKQQIRSWEELLVSYLEQNSQASVGQIGLDFRKDVLEFNSKDKQWHFFESQFKVAQKLNRSVTIHCVRAYGELLKFLKKLNKQYEAKSLKTYQKDAIKSEKSQKQSLSKQVQSELRDSENSNKGICIVLHSYGGSKEITKSLSKLNSLNLYFSLSLKRSTDILEFIPIEKLLIQTDSPYQNEEKLLEEYGGQVKGLQVFLNKKNTLQPKPLLKECKFFNKAVLDNTPGNVKANYLSLCQHYKMDRNEFISKVTRNAMKVFRILPK